MKNLFVSYEIAKMLKDVGFDEPCLASFNEKYNRSKTIRSLKDYKNSNHPNGNVTAPLYQQVTEWFRDEHNLHIEPYLGHDEDKIWWNIEVHSIEFGYDYEPIEDDFDSADTYNKAIENAVKQIIERNFYN